MPLDQRIVAIQEALNQFVPEAERAAVASDLFGDRAALAFLRIDAATLREAAQDVQDFGVAVSAADAAQIERTGDAIAKLSLIWLGLTNRLTAAVAPALETVANALADMARGTGPIGGAITAVFDNLARLATYAATFAAFMAGRWVAGLAVAALSVRGLATALVFLRGALIRTGIGALIVGAGELVYQFSQLVARVGGVGEAFRLLGDLAKEVWSRIGLSLDAAFANMAAGWEGLKAAGLSALEGTIAGVVSFGDRTAAIFQGAYDAAVAIWGSLPGAIGDFAFQAANGLISGVEAMLNGVVTRINNFINGLNAALDLLPDWAVGEGGVRIGTLDPVELARIGNPFEGAATAAGAAAADAFSAALSRTYLEPPDLGLGAMADDARGRADGYREAAGMLADAAGRPLASWQALRDAVTGTGSDAETALADAASSADALNTELDDTAAAAGSAGAAAREAGAAAADGADQAATGWGAVTAALADYATKARNIGGDIGQALVGAFHLGRECRGRVRQDRQARLPRSGHVDDRRSGQAGGPALHPRADCQRAVGSAWRCGRDLRQHPARGRHGRIAGPGPHGPCAGLRQCPAHACGRLGRDQARRGSGNPAARRARALPPRGRWIQPRLDQRTRRQRHHHGPRCRKLPAIAHAGGERHCPRRVAGPEGHVMAFHEVRFPDNISRGARGGPERRTQIVELASGDEERNASWANSRRRYDVAYGIRRADDLAAVVAFFEARNGRLHGFRYKDWADYKSCLPSQPVAPTDQPIGTGNGAVTTFALLKRYTSGAQSWTRAIAKPVAGTVRSP